MASLRVCRTGFNAWAVKLAGRWVTVGNVPDYFPEGTVKGAARFIRNRYPGHVLDFVDAYGNPLKGTEA